MGRTTKVVGFSVPPALADELERIAHAEHRTKSALFREMLRVYQQYRQQRDKDTDAWVASLIQEAQDEQVCSPMSVEEMLRESAALAAYGEAQTKKLGIKYRDIDRLIHDFRARQRPRLAHGACGAPSAPRQPSRSGPQQGGAQRSATLAGAGQASQDG